MTRLTIRMLGTLAVVALVVTLGFTALRAQQPAPQPEEEVLPALLQEVRLLRESIQQAVLVNSRMELSLRRLGHQQQLVSEYAGVLRSVQDQLGDVTEQTVELARQLSRMQESRRNATDQNMRDDLDGAIERYTAQIAALGTRQTRLRAEEADALQRLQAAESTSQNLERRLEELESVLANPRRR